MDLQKISIKNYKFTNWSRTFTCTPELFFVPETVDEIREILYLAKSERKRIRVVGCGASPSDICLSDDYMISLDRFNRVLHLDRDEQLVTVQGGIILTQLNRFLEDNDLALPVLGSISDTSLAGVISVGTHGTGFDTGILADYVTELRMIVPSGDIVVCNRDAQSELFFSALCGLGSLGIILEVTLQCQPAFYLHQLSYPSTLDSVLDTLDDLVESCDHFRFLWFPHTNYVSVSVVNRINGSFLQLEDLDYHNRRRLSSLSAEERSRTLPFKLSSEKSWYQRAYDWFLSYGVGYHALQFAYWLSTYIPASVPLINRAAFWLLYSQNSVALDVSYKIFNFECLFDQYVNEWCIPRTATAAVLRELRDTIERSAQTPNPLYAHFPVEVRFARGSPIYLAPTYGRDSTYINIISYRPYHKFVPHQQYWDLYEGIVKRSGGRPHWAKQHRETFTDLVRMYPYFRAWTQVRRRLDPLLLFSNSYMDRLFSNSNLDQSKASLFARKRSFEESDSASASSWCSSIVSTETADVKIAGSGGEGSSDDPDEEEKEEAEHTMNTDSDSGDTVIINGTTLD